MVLAGVAGPHRTAKTKPHKRDRKFVASSTTIHTVLDRTHLGFAEHVFGSEVVFAVVLLGGPIDCNKLIKWLHNYDRTATRRRQHSWINWHHWHGLRSPNPSA